VQDEIFGSEFYEEAKNQADLIALLLLRSKLAANYPDASGQFLLELMQNADDANAKSLEIRLAGSESSGYRLIVTNTGIPFDGGSFKTIIGAWASHKPEEQGGKIGRFGIGFKSVYFHAECADLISGNLRYRMPKYPWPVDRPWPKIEVPCPPRLWGDSRMLLDEDYQSYFEELPPAVQTALKEGAPYGNACFVLHLQKGAVDLIRKELQSTTLLRPDCLLFLRKLKRITISGFGENVELDRTVEPWAGWPASRPRILVNDITCVRKGPRASSAVYRVYRRNPPPQLQEGCSKEERQAYNKAVKASMAAIALPIDPEDRCEVALRGDDPRRLLWAWFPTQARFEAGFLVQGDFQLLSTRTGLDKAARDQNQETTLYVVSLLEAVLIVLCGEKGPLPKGWQSALLQCFTGSDSYNLDDYSEREVCETIRKKIKAFLRSHPGLPAAEGGGIATDKALMAMRLEWNRVQYGTLTTLLKGERLPASIAFGLKDRINPRERTWLAWEMMEAGLGESTWREHFSVAQVTREALATGHALSPYGAQAPEWLTWMGLIAELPWTDSEYLKLKTGLNWPALTSTGVTTTCLSTIWKVREGATLNHEPGNLEPCLFDPRKANATLVRRVDTRDWSDDRVPPVGVRDLNLSVRYVHEVREVDSWRRALQNRRCGS